MRIVVALGGNSLPKRGEPRPEEIDGRVAGTAGTSLAPART